MITSENWRELAKDVEPAVASIAHRYDPVASGNLIRYFHFALQDGALFDQCDKLSEVERGLIDFIGLAFNRYVESGATRSLDVAFGIARSRGRISEGNDERNVRIAAMVEQKLRSEKIAHGVEKMEAVCKEVAPQFSLGWKSIERIYSEFRVVMKLLGDAEISAIAEALIKSP